MQRNGLDDPCVVLVMGLEPGTSRLVGEPSTIELRRKGKAVSSTVVDSSCVYEGTNGGHEGAQGAAGSPTGSRGGRCGHYARRRMGRCSPGRVGTQTPARGAMITAPDALVCCERNRHCAGAMITALAQ